VYNITSRVKRRVVADQYFTVKDWADLFTSHRDRELRRGDVESV
jgi:hypothetical protein